MADKFPQSEPNFIQSHQVVLEAGRVSILECYGRTFVCVSATAGFEMTFNNGKYFDCRKGVEWSMNPDERYTLLKFRSAIAQTLSILTGNFFYHENVVTPVASVAQTFIKTAYDPVLVNPIAAGASYSLSGTGASGSGLGYRKHLILTNCDADLDLDVLDSADSLRGTVFARQANVFETSDTLKIKNNSGLPIEFRLMEIFYGA